MACNRHYGPGGSTRRLHHLRWFAATRSAFVDGAEPGSTGVQRRYFCPAWVCRDCSKLI